MLTISIDQRHLSKRATLITTMGGACLLFLLVAVRSRAQPQSRTSDPPRLGVGSLAGSNPTNYETGVDSQASFQRLPSAYLKAKQLSLDGFGTLMTGIQCGPICRKASSAKRIR